MPAPNGLYDLTWDSATCVRIALGVQRVPFTKFTPPSVETKVEKVKTIGQGRATKRTPGFTEIADMSAEMLATDYQIILAAQNRHGGDLMQFPILVTIGHPSVAGSYSIALDDCRIVKREGPDLDGSEKGLIKKLGINVMQVWEKGADGIWKCSSTERALPSSQLKPLIEF